MQTNSSQYPYSKKIVSSPKVDEKSKIKVTSQQIYEMADEKFTNEA